MFLLITIMHSYNPSITHNNIQVYDTKNNLLTNSNIEHRIILSLLTIKKKQQLSLSWKI